MSRKSLKSCRSMTPAHQETQGQGPGGRLGHLKVKIWQGVKQFIRLVKRSSKCNQPAGGADAQQGEQSRPLSHLWPSPFYVVKLLSLLGKKNTFLKKVVVDEEGTSALSRIISDLYPLEGLTRGWMQFWQHLMKFSRIDEKLRLVSLPDIGKEETETEKNVSRSRKRRSVVGGSSARRRRSRVRLRTPKYSVKKLTRQRRRRR